MYATTEIPTATNGSRCARLFDAMRAAGDAGKAIVVPSIDLTPSIVNNLMAFARVRGWFVRRKSLGDGTHAVWLVERQAD